MNQELALRVLGKIMDWDDARTRREFTWLSLMSRMKYDGYRDYLAGARFVERLVDWLQQFDKAEREAAYAFIRGHLVFIGPAELEHLVELVYPDVARPRLIKAVAQRLGMQPYLVWAKPEGRRLYSHLLRRTLFLGLSDGARIDLFRRANVGVISNEQIVGVTEIHERKWGNLVAKLRRDESDKGARFEFLFLIDDFVGSGTTLLRKEDGAWEGKLERFWTQIEKQISDLLEPDWLVCVHHYVSTHRARQAIAERNKEALTERGVDRWFPRVEFTFGSVLPEDLPIDRTRLPDFMRLVDRYYDPSIETDSTRKGGDNVKLGFGSCALPLVLEHNTPNNSVALLWAQTDGSGGHHAMRPLFRRRQRHVR